MIRIAFATTLTYYFIGYAIDNPTEAKYMCQSVVDAVLIACDKVETILVLGYTHK